MIEQKRSTIGTIPYEAGAPKTLELPKDFPFLGLNLRLSGRLNIAGGAVSGTPWTENPASLIERVRVFGTKIGGAVEIINIDGGSLLKLMHIFQGAEPELTAISSGAAADYDFVADIEVPLHVPRLMDEAEVMSMLPGWFFDQLTLEIKWRDGSLTAGGGLISGGDRTLTLTSYGAATGSPSISVVAKQAINVNPALHNPVLFKLYKKTLVTEAVEANRKEAMNKGGFYRALAFKAYADTAERAVSNTLLANVKLLIGGNVREDWNFKQLRAENKLKDFNLATMPDGYGIIDFCSKGDPDTMLDTSAFSVNGTSLETELNISAAAANNRVDVITFEAIPAGRW